MPVPSDPYAALISWLETEHEGFHSDLVCRNVPGWYSNTIIYRMEFALKVNRGRKRNVRRSRYSGMSHISPTLINTVADFSRAERHSLKYLHRLYSTH